MHIANIVSLEVQPGRQYLIGESAYTAVTSSGHDVPINKMYNPKVKKK
jgi:hypothetical protein